MLVEIKIDYESDKKKEKDENSPTQLEEIDQNSNQEKIFQKWLQKILMILII